MQTNQNGKGFYAENPQGALIHELIEAQVERDPEAIAVIDENGSVSYGQLNQRANQLAAYLRELGVGADQLVGICVGRGAPMVVGLLGILKAGGAYLPLDPCYPAERLQYMLRDAAPSVVVTEQELQARLPASAAQRVCLDSDWERIGRCSQENLSASEQGLHAGHLAYVIYTSGSTGQPKGVLIEHRNTVNLMYWAQGALERSAFAQTLASTSLNFDLAVYECFVPLSLGASVRVKANALQVMGSDPITLINTVPSAMSTLLEGGVVPRSVRAINVAGEPLKRSLVERIFAETGAECVCNLYGPSETTTYSTWVKMSREQGFDSSIGWPIANTQIYLLDSGGKPAAAGEAGEIYIGGAGVARGYLHRAELTAQRFLQDPFSANDGARMYKTGDLGRWRADGAIEFLGRNDFQVKIRGFRIELGEIETQLQEYPGVRDAVALAREDAPGIQRLVAYYTVGERGGAAVSTQSLRAHLQGVLPEYMVPSAFVLLESLPLTPNGKLDRKALPAPDIGNITETDYEPPVGGWEVEVATVWADALKVTRVGRNDGFASLAGTSIQAIEVSFHFGRKYAGGGRVSAPIGNATLAQYAQILKRELHQPETRALVPAFSLPGHDSGLASYAQQQVWFLEQLGDAARAYRFDVRFDFAGTLDVAALQSAFIALLGRHEILRTAFVPVEGKLERKIELRVEPDLRCVDFSSLPDAERAEALERTIAAELQRGFDTERAPLIRWVLIKLSDARHVLIQSEHHYLHDGQSFRIVVKDLVALYNAARSGMQADLPKIEAQYSEFCAGERLQFAEPQFLDKLGEWTRKLSALDRNDRLFVDRQTGGERRFMGAQLRRTLPAALAAAIDASAARRGLSRFSVMMSTFAVLCSRYSGCEKFLIGTALANRTSAKYQWTVGMFVNMLPIPFDCAANQKFDQFAHAVSRDIDFALARTDVPLSEIVTKLGTAATLKGEAPFSVGFSFHDSMKLTTCFDALDVEIEELLCNGSAKFDLDVVAILGTRDKSIELVFEYDTDRFDHDTVERLVTHYCVMLEEAVADPGRRLKEFSSLTHRDRQQLLDDWLDTSVEYASHASVQRLFEERAAEQPDALAVLSDEQELTYRDLNARANQLGHYLRSKGVGPEVAVVVCVDRSAELIVSLLGILKAGGIYVPVNSNYTQERLAQVVSEVDAAIILTLKSLVAASSPGSARAVRLDADWAEIARQPVSNLVRDGRPGNLAYCIFTSGSTGAPKGVAVSMQALVNHALSHAAACAVTRTDRVLQICAPGFDASLEEIVPTLISGAALILAPRDFKAPDEEFVRWMEARGITMMDVPTALWGVLVSYASAAGFEGKPWLPATLRALIIGGETARWEYVDAMRAGGLPPDFRLFNTYGPTETTIVATRGAVEVAAQSRRSASVPLGKATRNTRLYVLDTNLNPVPIGVKGQIYIAGAGVARGYWRRPDLTAERFIPDPFGLPGRRMYCSGDLGRYLPDGQIEFLGRTDSQVKISGFRVEPGEVEAMLLRQPGVREAAVITWSADGRDPRLAAYVVADELQPATREGLRKQLLRFLPEYMVPTAWSFLDRLPLNQNGKVDRKRLPPITPERAHTERQAGNDREPSEVGAILDILEELLPGVSIAPSDDLFAKGMHSLLALRLITRCRDRLGIKIRVRDLYALASPIALADHILQARKAAA